MLILTLLLALAAPQAATPDAPPPPKKEKKICRANEATGTRIAPTKSCKTEADWLAYDAKHGKSAEAAMDKTGSTSPY